MRMEKTLLQPKGRFDCPFLFLLHGFHTVTTKSYFFNTVRFMNTNELWGQDIALDENNNPKIAASGELVLTRGVETPLQDIKLRLFTRLGVLFYDKEYGSLIHDFIFEENTAQNRAALLSEIIMRIEKDPRVETGKVSAKILNWDEKGVQVAINFTLIGEDNETNLLLRGDTYSKTLIIEDINPTDKANINIL